MVLIVVVVWLLSQRRKRNSRQQRCERNGEVMSLPMLSHPLSIPKISETSSRFETRVSK